MCCNDRTCARLPPREWKLDEYQRMESYLFSELGFSARTEVETIPGLLQKRGIDSIEALPVRPLLKVVLAEMLNKLRVGIRQVLDE